MIVLLLIAALFSTGCFRSSAALEDESGSDFDTDAGTDTDADIDADTHTHTDAETNTDADTDSESDAGCVEDERRCQGEMMQRCVSGEWVDSDCLLDPSLECGPNFGYWRGLCTDYKDAGI